MMLLSMDGRFKEIVKKLVWQKQSIESEIQTIETSDPVLMQFPEEAAELGTAAWEADAHGTSVSVKNDLMLLSAKVSHALEKVGLGSYGMCEKCGKTIDPRRLEVLPIAVRCQTCTI